jgi:hypothetical protein
MYTVEFDHDEICITVMDDTGVHGDIKVRAYDDIVYITQDDEELDVEFVLEMNPAMWEELIAAIQSPEGFFRRVKSV